MKRVFASLTIASLLFIDAPDALSAIKSGDSCKILGKITVAKGKSYKCVNLKGKRVLQLQPRTSKAQSTPTPTPTTSSSPIAAESPAPVEKNLYGLSSEIALKGFISVTDYLSAQPELTTGEVLLDLSPNASATLSDATLQDMQKGFRFWQSFTPRTTKIHMVFADRKDLEWFKTTMERIQPNNQEWLPRIYNLAKSQPRNQYAGSNGLDSNGNALFFYLPGTETVPTSGGWLGVGPHEWTHFAQVVITGDSDRLPCWFKEGQATFYGNAISNNSKETWSKIWKGQIQTLKTDHPPFYEMSESTLRKWFADHELNMPNNVCGPDGAFIIGGLATEYLVGTIGVDGVNNFATKIKSNQNWKSAISEVTGKEFEDLMSEIISFVLLQRSWSLK